MVQESQRYQPQTTSLPSDRIDGTLDDDLNDIDAPPADDYILQLGELEKDEDDEEAGTQDDGQPPAWYASQQRMAENRAKFRRHDKDTGSPEYQIAGMTERINYLTGHLQTHPKDFSTRRGLVALVNKRRRLLNYLYGEDESRYSKITSELGIRHRAPGLQSRETVYGRFNPQKAVKKHLIKK
jgi:small subunit ribosomal protein S15